jgi:hypothetical protein
MVRKLLGVLCLLAAFFCMIVIGLAVGFIVTYGSDLTWWQLGLLLIPIPAIAIVLCAMLIATGLCLWDIY